MTEHTNLQQQNSQKIKVIPIMISLLIGCFMGMFSETALNMALNDLMIDLQIPASIAQWLTTSYLLVLGILIPISGLLIRRFPARKLFMAGLCFSIVGLFIEALASSFIILLFGRIIQAVGTGLLIPLLFNSVLILFPMEKRGTAMGVVGLVMMFAPAVGPIMAGLIIEQLNWHWIFWIPIPFLLFALVFGMIYMKNLFTLTGPKIDFLSIILSTIGFGGLVFGFSSAGEDGRGWASAIVIISLITGLLSIILFVLRQLSMKEPILNVRVFKKPMFSLGIFITLLCNMIIFSTVILLPLYMQGGLGISSAQAGLLLLPGGIINGVMALITGRIFDRYGPRWLVIIGFILSTSSVLVFANISNTTQSWTIMIFYTLFMVGMSMITTPSQTNGLNQLPRSLYPDGSAIVNTMIQTSGAIGTAIAVSILNTGQHSFLDQAKKPSSAGVQAEALIAGIRNAFIFAAIVSIIGLFCSFLIKRINVGEEKLKHGIVEVPVIKQRTN